jgi:hypothetical protein
MGDCYPTRGSPAARAPLGMYQPLSRGEGVGRCDWLLVRVVSMLRADMMPTRLGRTGWSQRAAKWRLAGPVNGRLTVNGVTWGNVPLTRLPHRKLRRLPFATPVGHQGQPCRALLMWPGRPGRYRCRVRGADVVSKTSCDRRSTGVPPFLRVFMAARVSSKAGVARFWKMRGAVVAPPPGGSCSSPSRRPEPERPPPCASSRPHGPAAAGTSSALPHPRRPPSISQGELP